MLTEMHAHVLRLINQSGPLSRTELGRELGVSKGSISALAADLIESGMLAEGEIVYGAGRPSIRLELAASSTFFVGVSLASVPFVMRLTDLHGRVVGEATVASGSQPQDVAAAVAQALDQVLADHGGARERLAGIGVAIPGLVNPSSGACVRSTLLGWRDVPIGPMIAEATGFATFVENDANALALGQHLFGSLRGANACAVVSVGDGIGCGLILGGELHRGARGGAGEIAHATIELNGLPCKCGKRGCLDTLASARSIANAARNAGLPEGLAALGEAADHGDQAAVAILHKAGEALGLAVSQLIQALDPDHILIALSDGPLDGSYAHVIRQTINANVMGSEAHPIDIAMMHLGPEAWAIGAASVAAGRGLFRI